MKYRILVDENTSPRVAESLRGKGHIAEHVHDVLKEGVNDTTISTFAQENDYVILMHDSDFLIPETRGNVRAIYYADDTIDTYEIADSVDELTRWVPDTVDLSAVTTLSE